MKKLYTTLLATAILTLATACHSPNVPEADACCKTCSTGKACGDTCINRKYDCTKPPGCACDG